LLQPRRRYYSERFEAKLSIRRTAAALPACAAPTKLLHQKPLLTLLMKAMYHYCCS
jgi:hypothetical protein